MQRSKFLSTLIAGAALDTHYHYPMPPDHPLWKFPNVIFSPHMAGVTKEANDRMAIAVMENILSVFDGKPIVAHCVNKEIYA